MTQFQQQLYQVLDSSGRAISQTAVADEAVEAAQQIDGAVLAPNGMIVWKSPAVLLQQQPTPQPMPQQPQAQPQQQVTPQGNLLLVSGPPQGVPQSAYLSQLAGFYRQQQAQVPQPQQQPQQQPQAPSAPANGQANGQQGMAADIAAIQAAFSQLTPQQQQLAMLQHQQAQAQQPQARQQLMQQQALSAQPQPQGQWLQPQNAPFPIQQQPINGQLDAIPQGQTVQPQLIPPIVQQGVEQRPATSGAFNVVNAANDTVVNHDVLREGANLATPQDAARHVQSDEFALKKEIQSDAFARQAVFLRLFFFALEAPIVPVPSSEGTLKLSKIEEFELLPRRENPFDERKLEEAVNGAARALELIEAKVGKLVGAPRLEMPPTPVVFSPTINPIVSGGGENSGYSPEIRNGFMTSTPQPFVGTKQVVNGSTVYRSR